MRRSIGDPEVSPARPLHVEQGTTDERSGTERINDRRWTEWALEPEDRPAWLDEIFAGLYGSEDRSLTRVRVLVTTILAESQIKDAAKVAERILDEIGFIHLLEIMNERDVLKDIVERRQQ